ncbi:MAG: serine hydrolase [Clostridia bacterium]|nr:serine hydrolase [Clostridia bacterium]
MNRVLPEEAGISSKQIKAYIEKLERAGLATHDMIIMRGDDVIFEAYWKPFTADFQHRLYSVSKSFIAIAIGFLLEEGKIDLDDPMEKYFAKELQDQPDQNMHKQTVRHMLMMATAKTPENWHISGTEDRVQFYFSNPNKDSRPSGTIFRYDSPGSFVLGALVERITGKPFMEYLNEKLFCKIGVSPDAYCLKCPGGHSWGDSAIIMRPMDLARVARFMLNGGKWNGEQILSESFVKEATGKRIDNNTLGNYDYCKCGYGYLIWRTYEDSFFFNGMGCQFAICVPHKDLVFVYNADNQGNGVAKNIIIDSFFEMIVDQAEDAPLPADPAAEKDLADLVSGLTLFTAKGDKKTSMTERVQDKTYVMNENDMGITKFSLHFEGNGGVFRYTNAQGDKEIAFGMCENVYGKFPQEGYSNMVGSVKTKNFYYDCAASAAWVEEQKLFIKVQVIDTYFGNLSIIIHFKDNVCGVCMEKTAENFLNEYKGFGEGTLLEA